jgi:hypothetical protein
MPRPITIVIACRVAAPGRAAAACPSCPTSDVVWANVLGDDFAANVAVTLLPFVVIAALVAAARRALGRRE